MIANTKPLLKLPPKAAVPNKVPPARRRFATYELFLNVDKLVKPLPSVFKLKKVPVPVGPPPLVVPMSLLPTKIRAFGPSPSQFVADFVVPLHAAPENECSTENPEPSVLIVNIVPAPEGFSLFVIPPPPQTPYTLFPDAIKQLGEEPSARAKVCKIDNV